MGRMTLQMCHVMQMNQSVSFFNPFHALLVCVGSLQVERRPLFTSASMLLLLLFLFVIDAAAPVVVVVVTDFAAVTQLLVVCPLLTEQLSKLI